MTEPIVFVSHFRVKEGKLDALKQYSRDAFGMLEADKPRTTGMLAYMNDEGTELSIVHLFSDAHAMDLHVQGAEQRASAAYEFMDPAGWEIYGRPSDDVVQMMRTAATSAGVTLSIQSDHVGGFLRTPSV